VALTPRTGSPGWVQKADSANILWRWAAPNRRCAHQVTLLESSDTATVDFFTFIVILAAVFAGHVAWGRRRLNQWAVEQRLRILGSRYCFVNIGPFSQFGTSAGQAIFRIEAQDAAGHVKTGYARTGGFIFGLLRRRVEVKWDERPWRE